MNWKRHLEVVLVTALFLLFLSGVGMAKVSGVCSDCHTMHNSQNGSVVASNGPYPVLLTGTCVSCHRDSTGNTTRKGTSHEIPVVWTATAPTDPASTDPSYTNMLAGGNFYWVAQTGGDAKGHNVEGIVAQDSTLGNSPPGYNSSYDPSTVGFNTTYRLTCAGSNGCHGDRDIDRSSYSDGWNASFAAIHGAHHGDDSTIDGSTVSKSYRFLNHVLGLEDADWQATVSSTDHNEYKGATYASRSSQSWTTVDTISELCAECHGDFHMSSGVTAGTGSPWLRHPTDAVIPNSGEYASYTTYSVLAPVARTTIPSSPSSTVTPGTDVVMCLSCHRAHGSPYNDILRWDYSTCNAGTPNSNCGCFVCHTQKD